jgi:ubiquinone/menaquinone biosynthesis C-methylase UbiE
MGEAMTEQLSAMALQYRPGSLITRREFIRIASFLLAKQSDTPRIVDIGCSIGDMFENAAINVDIKSLDEMKAEAKPHHGDIEIPNYIQADAARLPFKDKEFDVAVLSEILEHVDDPVAVIREAKRVARFVIISVPNEYMWSPDKKPFTPRDLSGHQRQFTAETLFQAVEDAEMHILEFMDWQYLGWAYFIMIGE